MKGGIVTFEVYEGRSNIGSSRIRGKWLAKYWEGVEIFRQGQKYDFIIYQKTYWVEHARAFTGIKIFDLCDPDFLHFGYRTKEMIEEVDVITTSTEALAVALRQFTDKPVICVPDRLDLEEHKLQKKHIGRAKSVVWFGYSTGFPMIDTAIKAIEELGLNLIVIADQSYLLPIQFVKPEIQQGMTESEQDKVLQDQDKKEHWIELINYKWSPDTVNADIIKGDMVINPKVKTGKWKFKSNNKTLTAKALGMPVANSLEDLEFLLDEKNRIKTAEDGLIEVKEKWNIKQSVVEMKSIIKTLQNKV